MHDVVQAAAPPVTAHVPLMTLAGLRKSFGPVQALKGVDVLIMPGEVHAIVGENGAGKSTLIGIAAGVLQADAGAIYYDGKYVEAPDPRRMREGGVSAVYQHPALAPDLTVLENLQLAAPSLAGPGGAEAADGILARIATAELRMPINRRVAELSLAQRHVVEIARALATRPKVLFLDEPTEPLQQADVRKLFGLIEELKRDGVAIVYVSHRLHEVDELADRISVMRDGEIIDSRPAQSITPAEIVTLIAGRPLGQIFPAKAARSGRTLFDVDRAERAWLRRGQSDGPCRRGDRARRASRRRRASASSLAPPPASTAAIPARYASRMRHRRRQSGRFSPRRHRLRLRRSPRRGRVPQLDAAREFQSRLFGSISRFGVVDRGTEADRSKAIINDLRIRAPSSETKLFELSGGNQQKALFGREISAEPRVLLVDEPTKGVDIGARSEIYQRLRASPIRAWRCWSRLRTASSSKAFAIAC